jgi:hypothetical protein
MNNIFYVYIYLDPRKPGSYEYGKYSFKYEPFYVGKGKENRMYDHLKDESQSYKSNKIQKLISEGYNLENYIIKIKDNMEEQEAFDLEIKLISLIGRLDLETGPLTNMTDGGEGISGHLHTEESKRKISESLIGFTHTKETKEKMSKIKKGHKHSEETKKKISKSNSDENHHMYGEHHSEETKKKMSESLIGFTHTEETKNKMSESHKGKKLSEETKNKISGANSGENNYFYNKHHTEESKRKISETHKGKPKSKEHKLNLKRAAKNKLYNLTCKNCICKFQAKGPRTKYCNECKGDNK